MKNIIFLLLAFSSHTIANDDWDIQGYFGYRYLWSSIDQELMPLNSKPEIGLIGSWEPDDNWGVYGQLIYEERNPLENMIVYGFIEYEDLFYSMPYRFQLGKLQNVLGLSNASRLNPRTRPGGTVLPQAIYWSGLNLLLTSGYGIKAEIDIEDFTFSYSISKPVIDSGEFAAFTFFSPFPDMPNAGFTDNHVAYISYNPKNSKFTSKLSFQHVTLSDSISDMQWIGFGIGYQERTWNIQVESFFAKLAGIEWKDGISAQGYGIAVYGEYDISKQISLRMGYSGYKAPQDLLDVVQQFVPFDNSVRHQNDIWIGGVYNYNNWDFNLDIHKVYGGNFIRPNNWVSDEDYRDWWYMGTSLVYHF